MGYKTLDCYFKKQAPTGSQRNPFQEKKWMVAQDSKMDKLCVFWNHPKNLLKGQVIVVRHHEHSAMHATDSDHTYYFYSAIISFLLFICVV